MSEREEQAEEFGISSKELAEMDRFRTMSKMPIRELVARVVEIDPRADPPHWWVAVWVGDRRVGSMAREDAAYVVEAINSYPALQKALTDCRGDQHVCKYTEELMVAEESISHWKARYDEAARLMEHYQRLAHERTQNPVSSPANTPNTQSGDRA